MTSEYVRKISIAQSGSYLNLVPIKLCTMVHIRFGTDKIGTMVYACMASGQQTYWHAKSVAATLCTLLVVQGGGKKKVGSDKILRNMDFTGLRAC